MFWLCCATDNLGWEWLFGAGPVAWISLRRGIANTDCCPFLHKYISQSVELSPYVHSQYWHHAFLLFFLSFMCRKQNIENSFKNPNPTHQPTPTGTPVRSSSRDFKGVYHEQLWGHRALGSARPPRWSRPRSRPAASAEMAGNGGRARGTRGGIKRHRRGGTVPADPGVNVFISRCGRGSLYRNISCWTPRGVKDGGKHVYSNVTIK